MYPSTSHLLAHYDLMSGSLAEAQSSTTILDRVAQKAKHLIWL